MKELSLHILDIVQNSIQAGASEITVEVMESSANNTYSIIIKDNGKGMEEQEVQRVLDPFYTTKHKKTGLGIPLLKQHTDMANGSLNIYSQKGTGTIVNAVFQSDHLDRQPMGDIAKTMASIIRSNPSIEIIYKHQVNSMVFTLDTREIKKELEDILISSSEVINFLEDLIRENLQNINAN